MSNVGGVHVAVIIDIIVADIPNKGKLFFCFNKHLHLLSFCIVFFAFPFPVIDFVNYDGRILKPLF